MHVRPILPAVALVAALLPCSAIHPQDAPTPAREAPARMTLPEGFHVTLFAGEPDVVQPIAFCIDDRGRLWVAECYSYPNWHKDPKQGKDRILIFEDTDGDGRFDKRTVFCDKLANLSGIQVGFGGVWVCATPNLLFIPDRNGDDVPDGPPEVVLDGWDRDHAQHNVFNGLTWGPDGWLYGCNGIQSKSKVGLPGTPEAQRVTINCGVWRYHPLTKHFEAVAHGTTNPWGLDFDDYGEMFITNCVIEHLFHVIPGGHYKRMYGEDIIPHSYGLLGGCADHLHWGGGHWTDSRGGKGVHSDAGGGHAHVGCMLYLGDNWPARYHNGVFMCNLHGNRINHDVLERNGSTYVARHGKDFLLANDPWFRGLSVQLGPDGGAYVSDWTDTGECHNYKVADKTNGRIYKITYGAVRSKAEDLARLSDVELVQRQVHANDWHVRHARRLLQERAATGRLSPAAKEGLTKILKEYPDVRGQLRALWALHSAGALHHETLAELLGSPREHLRAWAVRLALERPTLPPDLVAKLGLRATQDASPLVRLALASGLQRLSLEARWNIAEELVGHGEDMHDPAIPLMLWYGIEPLVPANPARAEELLISCRIPVVREYIARRLVSLGTDKSSFGSLVTWVGKIDSPLFQRDVLRGVEAALTGRRDVPMPAGWKDAYPVLLASPLAEVREKALALAVQFGDERALRLLRETVADRTRPARQREEALRTLVFQKKADLVPLLHQLLHDDALRGAAIRSLAQFGDPQTPKLLLDGYAKWNAAERADAIQTLSSRGSYAVALLDGLDRHIIPRTDVTSYTIRQLQQLKSAAVSSRLTKVWGEIRPASTEKAQRIAKYKAALRPETLKNANLANGRALFAKHCASCHRLFGEGGDIGPDLTGSQRANLDYVLENILDPSAIVAREYLVSVVTTTSGRVLTGIIKAETPQTITVQTQNEKVVVPKDDIESRTLSPLSMMPEGLIDPLRPDEVRDLVAYLAAPSQVPMAPPK